jgi:hypothetical protein
MHTGYAGMDSHEAYLVPDHVTDNELDEWAYYKAVDHAESYGIYPPSEDGFEEEGDYSGDNIDGSWRLFEDKDVGKVMYGHQKEVHWNKY